MKNKNRKTLALTIGGFLVMIAGLVLLKNLPDIQGLAKILSYILVAIGCVVFGSNLGEFIKNKALATDPELARRIEIEQKDERNMVITARAKARAFDIMLFVYGVMMLAFALARFDFVTIIFLAISYLAVIGSWIFYLRKYQKEM
jgi:hypothetical protein